MAAPVSSVTQAPPAAQSPVRPSVPKPKESAPTGQPAAKPTVKISNAGQAALKAALAESIETPSQTAKEARAQDAQAIRRLAKEAATKV